MLNFAIPSFTLCQKIRYITKGIQPIFKNFPSAERCGKIGIWEENLMSAAILVLQWQAENFFHVEEFEISHFQTVHCAIKNAISPNVFNRFSKKLSFC